MRQKAVATGPISLRRTKIGDRAMPSAPIRRAISAVRAVRSAVAWWTDEGVAGDGVVGIRMLLRGGEWACMRPMDTGLRGFGKCLRDQRRATGSIPPYGAFRRGSFRV